VPPLVPEDITPAVTRGIALRSLTRACIAAAFSADNPGRAAAVARKTWPGDRDFEALLRVRAATTPATLADPAWAG
jgi:hypothetical protein